MPAAPLVVPQGGSTLVLPGASTPTVVVRGQDGIPLPPSHIVAEIKKRCGAEYDLKFSAGLASSGWDVARVWPENDPRRAWIQAGKYDPESAWDRIGSLPFSCSLEQAPAYLERMFSQYPALDANEVRRIRDGIAKWNTVDVPQAQHAAIVADVMEDIARDQRAPKGQVVTSGKTGRSKRNTAKGDPK